MNYEDFKYPNFDEENEKRVVESICKKIREKGLEPTMGNYFIGLNTIEECIPVTFSLFQSVIEAAKNYKKYVFRLKEEFNYDLFSYPSSNSANQVLNSLEVAMLDVENKYISFYIHVLDFGKKYEDGMVIDDNGYNFDLIKVEDLWMLLLMEIRKRIMKVIFKEKENV